MDTTQEKYYPNPREKANPLSLIFFTYTIGMFKKGCQKTLEVDDLYNPIKADRSTVLGDRLERKWMKQLQAAKKRQKKPSLLKALIATFWPEFLYLGAIMGIMDIFVRLTQPIVVGNLLEYFRPNSTVTETDAFWQAGTLIVLNAANALLMNQYLMGAFHSGMKLRAACCALIYRKALRLSKVALGETASGKIVNLLSNDVSRFDIVSIFIHYMWISPLAAIFVVYYLYKEAGYAGLVGIVTVFLVVPLQGYTGKLSAIYRKQTAVKTDERVRMMDEVISGIHVIKMYAWEKPFDALIKFARKIELKVVAKSAYLRGLFMTFNLFTTRAALFATLMTMVLTDQKITTTKIFIFVSFFNYLSTTMSGNFVRGISEIAELLVAINRLQEFMMLEEYKPIVRPPIINDKKKMIGMKNVTVKWTATSEETALLGINLNAGIGELLGIIGPVGSGKSSLLQTLLGELDNVSGNIEISGVISYASQEPWIFAATVRQNILFGQSYDKIKYREVIHACALQQDFEQFPEGDLTFVGDRGASLSGGQKARINLARAVYRDADIYLFDDPLSAVDIHVSKHLYDICINKYLAKKTRILVTHQVHHLKNADNIIILNNGQIEQEGTFAQITQSKHLYAELLTSEPEPTIEEEQGNVDDYTKVKRKSFKKNHPFEDLLSTPDIHDEYVANQTRILVTHQVHNLKNADHILTNGQTEDKGTFAQIPDNENPYEKLLRSEKKPNSEADKRKVDYSTKMKQQLSLISRKSSLASVASELSLPDSMWCDAIEEEDETEETQLKDRQEDSSKGKIAGSILVKYFCAAGNFCLVILVLILLALCQGMASGVDYFVSFWINIEEFRNITNFQTNAGVRKEKTVEWSTELCIYVCGGAIGLLFIIALLRSFLFYKLCVISSQKLHDMMFTSILKAQMRFFDTNPSGRILNRFAKDMGSVDEILPKTILDTAQILLIAVGNLVLVAIVNRYLIIMVVIVGVFFFLSRYVYLKTSKSIKRLEGILRSPVFTHLNATLQGLTTIRSFRAQDILKYEFDKHQDFHTSAWFMFITASAAFGFAIDILCFFFVAVVTLSFLTFSKSLGFSGGDVGLAITQAISLIGFTQWGMRQSAEMTNQLTSVERILEYQILPQEKQPDVPRKPPSSWPNKGSIKFENMGLTYVEDGPLVLKQLNIEIQPNEKVGIVGRTGAGKSSLITALFRLANVHGSVKIDDIDAKEILLQDLRSKISIIPQDPVLFSGTLRYNLDPFEEYSDEVLYKAIEDVELRDPANIINRLENRVLDRGANYSVGQRQLICLARALVRKNKILMLDEATANVDPQTDALIQKTIRKKFADCTVLTVAHRLNTIMDSDKVLVMEAGEMVEYDHPHILLQNPKGFFYKMVAQADKSLSEQLIKIAKESYQKYSSVPE